MASNCKKYQKVQKNQRNYKLHLLNKITEKTQPEDRESIEGHDLQISFQKKKEQEWPERVGPKNQRDPILEQQSKEQSKDNHDNKRQETACCQKAESV